jgi:polysaccharide pyruvyl transferase WcaK-like protein
LYYLSLAWLARLFRRPVLLVAAGIGPLKGGLSRHFVGRALRRTAYLSVRDAASRRLALSLGVSPSRIHSEADPVLSLTPAPQEAAVAFLNGHLPPEAGGRRYLCIVPRPGCMDEAVFARILRRLYEKEGIYPLFLAFDRAEDTPVCDRLIAACGVGCRIPSEDEALVAALFGLPEVVGVAAGRLHALIVAHVAGKAAVALIGNGCDGKVTGFARSVGGGILRPKMNVEEIECTLSRLWKEED